MNKIVVISEPEFGVYLEDMNDGDMAVIVKWGLGSTGEYVGRVVQRFNDVLVSVGMPYGKAWTTILTSNLYKRSDDYKVRILRPGTTFQIQ